MVTAGEHGGHTRCIKTRRIDCAIARRSRVRTLLYQLLTKLLRPCM